MPDTREFDLSDILTVTTDTMLSQSVGGVYKLLGFMVDESLMTHQLPRAMHACAPALIEQHPWLADIKPPARVPVPELLAWLTVMEMTHGKRHSVSPDASRWQRKDALAEFDQMMGTRPVIAI